MPTSSDPAGPERTAIVVTHESVGSGIDDTGIVADYLRSLGFRVVHHRVFRTIEGTDPDRNLPSPEGADLVIVFGSSEHAWEPRNRDWVEHEVDWVRQVLDLGIPYLGICFGSQLLALANGGSVDPMGEYEAGMLRFDTVDGCPVAAGPWFSWHGDVITPPAGATVWASSELAPQVFTLGRALGLQFHPEVSAELARAWIDAWPEALEGRLTQEEFRRAVDRRIDDSQAGCRDLIDWVLAELPVAHVA